MLRPMHGNGNFRQVLHRRMTAQCCKIEIEAEQEQPKSICVNKLMEHICNVEKKPSLVSLSMYARLLRECANFKVHSLMNRSGLNHDTYLGNLLISMYAKCGSPEDARALFDKMHTKDIVSWNALISAYAHKEDYKEATHLFGQMLLQGMEPNRATFTCILNSFFGIEALIKGKLIHARIMQSFIVMNVMLATTILKMYGKCGSLRDVHVIFGWLQHRDLVSWTVMITEYARQGRSHEAFMLFRHMEEEGIKPNVVTFTGMLNAYSTEEALEEGKLGHASIIYNGLNLDIVLGTALFSMYKRCGSMWDAKRMFDSTPNKNAVSWTAMIAAYVEHGQGKQAVQMFREMGRQKLKPNEVTFIHILSVCSNSEGKLFHGQVIRDELRPRTVLINALISMYGRGGSIEEALHLFNKLEERSVVSWNALIVAYSQTGDVQSAHRTFNRMPCHTLVSWTALIGAYAQHGYSKKSLQLFRNLYIEPDKVVFVSVIEACCNGALYSDGKITHANILARGWELDTIIGTALVNMYGKCASLYDALFMFERMLHQNVIAWNTIIAVNAKYGSFEKACLIFHDMPHKDIVSWTTIILASAEYGYSEESIRLYYQMLQENIPPNKVTFVSVVDACTRLESLTKGILIHLDIVRHGCDSDIIVKTALLNMYGKCGLLGDARQMFDELPKRNVVSFTAMIAAYAQHGLAKEALELFYEMQQDGTKPNEITFLSILSACSHSGLWDNGQHCFVSMCADYGILPLVDHYYSLLNLISHVGWFNEAEDFVSEMPFQVTSGAWRTLLSACTNHGNLELGKYAAEHMVNLNPLDSTAYVLLSNTYAIDLSWADELGLQWESMVHEMFH